MPQNSKIKWLLKELPKLVSKKIILRKEANNIEKYYIAQLDRNNLKKIMITLFGILGAILIGSGIILLIAHNWEKLGKLARTFVALFPLICVQAAVPRSWNSILRICPSKNS